MSSRVDGVEIAETREMRIGRLIVGALVLHGGFLAVVRALWGSDAFRANVGAAPVFLALTTTLHVMLGVSLIRSRRFAPLTRGIGRFLLSASALFFLLAHVVGAEPLTASSCAYTAGGAAMGIAPLLLLGDSPSRLQFRVGLGVAFVWFVLAIVNPTPPKLPLHIAEPAAAPSAPSP